MLKFLRKFRKKFRTACLTAALATCWNVGQTAQAAYGWDEVTLKLTGTVSRTESSVSNLFLLYGLNNSYIHEFYTVNLGDFPAQTTTDFSMYITVPYDEDLFDSPDRNMYWEAAGLYGDISGGTYTAGVNGVTLGINAAEGDLWSSHCWNGEGEIFNKLLNDSQDYLPSSHDFDPWYSFDYQGQQSSLTINLYDFSNASLNGQIQFDVEVVPEPVSIVLLGTGGMIIVALRRRNQ